MMLIGIATIMMEGISIPLQLLGVILNVTCLNYLFLGGCWVFSWDLKRIFIS